MKILFQGDSITDGDRNREDAQDLGSGYVKYAAALMAERHPDMEFEFVNLGISGDETGDLVARLQRDFVDIGADIVSVLVGVNDTTHRSDTRQWLDNGIFENNLRKVYSTVKNEMGAKLVVLETYIIPSSIRDWFRVDLGPKMHIIRALAREYADVYIPLDGLLSAAYIGDDPAAFSADGVHLLDHGARFVGKVYADAVEKLL